MKEKSGLRNEHEANMALVPKEGRTDGTASAGSYEHGKSVAHHSPVGKVVLHQKEIRTSMTVGKPDSFHKDGIEFFLLPVIVEDGINTAASIVFDSIKKKGFHTAGRTVAEEIALMHSELSELLEADRKGQFNDQCDKNVPLSNAEEECADLFIRLADFCGKYGINLGHAVRLKHAYNLNRPHKHGKAY